MKKLLAAMLALFLCGCSAAEEPGMELRRKLLSGPCAFQAEVTADYGDTLNVFTLDCQGDSDGNITFSVAAPETIQGISGSIAAGKGALTFDETVLAFPLLADGRLSPVSAPWLLLRVLRGGNLLYAGADGAYTRLTLQDGYREEDLVADVWLDREGTPVQGEFCYKNRKILSIRLLSFRTEAKDGT